MTQDEALIEATKIFGKHAHVSDSGFDSTPEMRKTAWEKYREATKQAVPNKRIIKQLRRTCDRYRYVVGTISFGGFVMQESEGDTWAECFERLSRRIRIGGLD